MVSLMFSLLCKIQGTFSMCSPHSQHGLQMLFCWKETAVGWKHSSQLKPSSEPLKCRLLWSWERFGGGEEWQLRVINQMQLSFHLRASSPPVCPALSSGCWQLVSSYVNAKQISEWWQFLQLLVWAVSSHSLLKMWHLKLLVGGESC